jgi:hypothetical protein
MAPAEPGRALVGPGPSEVASLLAWESAGAAALLTGDASPDGLAAPDAVVAFTRSAELIAGLRKLSPRVVVRDPQPAAGVHAAAWLTAALGDLDVPDAGVPAPLRPTAAETEAARGWVDRLPPAFVAVHPGSGSPTKRWPAERFADVVAALTPEAPWLLVRGPADGHSAAPLRALPGVVQPPPLPPRVLAALLARAALYVGNDSGVSHLAAAAGAPTLALFGPTDPASWAPVGPRVEFLWARGPMETLAIEEVVTAARRMAAPRG